MKTLFNLVSAILFFFTLSAHAEVRENGGRRAPLAVEIVFSSLGSGIDRDLKMRVDAVVQDYRDASMVTYYTEKSWGREGEITLCAQFVDFKTAYAFDRQVKRLIGNSRDTRYQRILSCDKNQPIDPRE